MKKIKRIFNFVLESLAIILFSLLIVVLLQKIIITLLNNFNFNISIDCGNLLSGIIGSILSCFFVMVGFFINKNSKKIDNQLVLRNMFSEKLRWEAYRTLEIGDVYAKPFVQTLFSKNNELSSHRFCLQSICYQTCFVNFIRSFVVQPLMNPFTIEELYKFPETFSQFLCT